MEIARTSRRTRSAAVLAAVILFSGAGALVPTVATAAPGTAAEARKLVEENAQRLTVIDEQVHRAALTVEEQQQQARVAARAAAEADAELAAFEPLLRAIAATGFTQQSRMAAFLTSDSADDLVQQMTTLDVIATHTETIVAAAAAAQDRAVAARSEAEAATARAEAGLAELEEQKAELQRRTEEYQADFARLSAQEQAAVTTAVGGRSIAAPDLASLGLDASTAAATVIRTALSKVGAPYAWGASGPDAFDCSGFTSFAYAAAGVSLPHSSGAQSGVGRPVSRAELEPGDLVFFYEPISHVGLYIGGGMMVHARTYGSPVAVVSVDQAGYAGATRPLH